MKFYFVKDPYIAHLRAIDSMVPPNYGETRPFVGVMLKVGVRDYLAPLTSHKPKHDAIKNGAPTIFKLHEPGNPSNKLGMIQINNMIPVADGQAVLLDIQAESVKYQNLLGHQLAFIKSNQDAIKSRADKLYKLVVVDKHPHWSKLSCRFLELEAACTAFELAQAQPQPAATGQENAV